MNGKTPHIVQYQGSKRKLAGKILEYMPCKFSRLVEPFAGMAAVSIAAASQDRADEYILNDINFPVAQILQSAVETPQKLASGYAEIWNEQFVYPGGSAEHYYKVREDFNNGNQSAAMMLYLLARCVKGSPRYGSDGNFNQSPDRRRNGVNPETLRRNIEGISSCLRGRATFMSADYTEVLDMVRKGDIVYMDPPYQGVSGKRDSRYVSGVLFEDFVKSIETLNTKGIDFIISYDGRLGDKTYGNDIPSGLNLEKITINAGVSTQSILLGKKEVTYESLYVSKKLFEKTYTSI
jgi:DNA adenine methylase